MPISETLRIRALLCCIITLKFSMMLRIIYLLLTLHFLKRSRLNIFPLRLLNPPGLEVSYVTQ